MRQDLLRERAMPFSKQIGAGDGIRTRNPQLGKLMRYRCATPARKDEKKIVKDAICVNPRYPREYNS